MVKKKPSIDDSPYLYNFLNKILIDPLAELMRLRNRGATFESLQLERNYISALPPDIKKGLTEYRDKIDFFLEKYYSVVDGFKPHPAATSAKRRRLLIREGDPLAQRVYDILIGMLYDGKLFEALKGAFGFHDPSLGGISGKSGRDGIKETLSSEAGKHEV